MRYTGAEASRPHGVGVSVNWANESLTTDPMPNSVNDLRLTHRMSKEGNLMLEVLVFNGVSSQRILLHASEVFLFTKVNSISLTLTDAVTMICLFSLATSSPSSRPS